MEYRVNRSISVFLSGRNVNSVVDDTLTYSPTTRADRRITGRAAYGATCYFGVKGTF